MQIQTLACLNGEILPADEAKVSIWDRGFLLGDAIYEVYRLYGGRLWLEAEHTARLRRSLAEMHYQEYDFDRLADRIARTIAESGVQEGTVYIQVTRGVAPRRHAFPGLEVPPTELVVVRPYDDTETAGLRQSGIPVISHPDLRWRRCDVKSTNLLANVLANEAAHRAGCIEAVLVDEAGYATEATHSSLLWVRKGRLEATDEGPIILPGTSRICTLRLAKQGGIPFQVARITLEDLKRADEVMLTGTTIEVLPVVQIDGTPIGDGQPGPITRSLVSAFGEAVQHWLTREPQPA